MLKILKVYVKLKLNDLVQKSIKKIYRFQILVKQKDKDKDKEIFYKNKKQTFKKILEKRKKKKNKFKLKFSPFFNYLYKKECN